MTHAEYFDFLSKVGMGWIGWTSEETDAHLMTDIEMAYEGRVEMLKFHRGDPPDKPKAKNRRALTPELFDSMFG